jgi:hypothetical protein
VKSLAAAWAADLYVPALSIVTSGLVREVVGAKNFHNPQTAFFALARHSGSGSLQHCKLSPSLLFYRPGPLPRPIGGACYSSSIAEETSNPQQLVTHNPRPQLPWCACKTDPLDRLARVCVSSVMHISAANAAHRSIALPNGHDHSTTAFDDCHTPALAVSHPVQNHPKSKLVLALFFVYTRGQRAIKGLTKLAGQPCDEASGLGINPTLLLQGDFRRRGAGRLQIPDKSRLAIALRLIGMASTRWRERAHSATP